MSLSVKVRHRFGAFQLDAAFETPGGITGLIGPSGAGKTTVVNAIAGLLRPDEGRVILGKGALWDSATGAWRPPRDRGIGYVFQDHRLFPHMTVAGNLDYGRWVRGQPRDRDKQAQIVALLGLEGLLDRRIGGLSGGERARVGIARALLSGPRLLLMDEPLAALDSDRKAEILPYLERLRDKAAAPIVYVSHALDEVIRLANTLVVMREGKVVQAGPVGDLLSDPASLSTLGPEAIGALLPVRCTGRQADGLSEVRFEGGTLWVPGVERAVPDRALRVRIRASDVLIARDAPTGLSALNVLPATVGAITPHGPACAMVLLHLGPHRVLAQITRRSVGALDLVPGTVCHAILKSAAVTPSDVSWQTG